MAVMPHVTLTWASELILQDPRPILPEKLEQQQANTGDVHFRSETDLAVNIRKATSIGESHYWVFMPPLTYRLYRGVCSKTFVPSET